MAEREMEERKNMDESTKRRRKRKRPNSQGQDAMEVYAITSLRA